MRYGFYPVLVFVLIVTAVFPSWAKPFETRDGPSFDMKAFAQIPVLHDGRIKPMDSFARVQLNTLSGRDAKALPWLVETLFNPALAEQKPVLKIRNPDVLNVLEIKKRKEKFYSYREISRALEAKQEIVLSILQTSEEQWTPAQRDLIVLQQNAVLLGDLLSSLTLFLPLSVTLPESVPDVFKPYAGQSLTYLETLKFREALQVRMESLVREKGDDIDRYTDAEQALAYLSFTVNSLRQAGGKSTVFRVIPDTGRGSWLSPWGVILNGAGRPETSGLFEGWKNMAFAYHLKDYQLWTDSVEKIYSDAVRLGGKTVRPGVLEAERLYNRFQPFYLSAVFYAVSLLFLIGVFSGRQGPYIRFAAFSLSTGTVLHFAGIAARIYILERPPVSTLYESILFAGLVAVLYGLWAYRRDQKTLWLLISGASGIFLHLLGFSQGRGGDSFLMLTAVLNTDFWLATHVLCITAGYGFCLVTSFLAHFVLVKTAVDGRREPDAGLFRSLHLAALLALLFAAVGTVLGGIWADQSWGRFWGWDPKENGALLIVLWLIWLLHGRISGQMSLLFVTAGLACLSVIVGLSWFGVNLLSVGLHAYGFTDSMAWALGLFTAVETLFVVSAIFYIQGRGKGIADGS